MYVYTLVGTSSWTVTEGHNPICACGDSEWLRGQKILTFQAWIILPMSLIHLLSSGPAVQQRRLTGLQSYVKPVHLRKDRQFPQTKIHSVTESFFGSQVILLSFVLLFFLSLLFAATVTHLPLPQINFPSIFRGADGNPRHFKQLPKHCILEGHSAEDYDIVVSQLQVQTKDRLLKKCWWRRSGGRNFFPPSFKRTATFFKFLLRSKI